MLKLPGNILCLASWYREVPSGAGCRGFETLNHVVGQIWIQMKDQVGKQILLMKKLEVEYLTMLTFSIKIDILKIIYKNKKHLNENN